MILLFLMVGWIVFVDVMVWCFVVVWFVFVCEMLFFVFWWCLLVWLWCFWRVVVGVLLVGVFGRSSCCWWLRVMFCRMCLVLLRLVYGMIFCLIRLWGCVEVMDGCVKLFSV